MRGEDRFLEYRGISPYDNLDQNPDVVSDQPNYNFPAPTPTPEDDGQAGYDPRPVGPSYPIDDGYAPPTPTPAPPPEPVVPPTAFNPPLSAAIPFSSHEEPPLNQRDQPPPAPSGPINQPSRVNQNTGGTSTRPGSYKSFRPNLRSRDDAYLRGFGAEPGFVNSLNSGFGGLRLGGFSDPANPLLSEEEKLRKRKGYSGAFGLGLGA